MATCATSRPGCRARTPTAANARGYLAACKGDTDELLWRVRVYVIKVNPHLEGDVQDVFFTALALSPDGHQIFVDNEDGGRFAVDIDGDHAVHARP